VRNLIEVAGTTIADKDLQAKLLEKLEYDRVGYGNLFNAISLSVENGVANLGGHARTDVDKDSALALVATTPGVKDLVDNIEVDPVSQMDDQTRMAVARAVYGYSTLNKYAIDPASPSASPSRTAKWNSTEWSTRRLTRTWPTCAPTASPASSA